MKNKIRILKVDFFIQKLLLVSLFAALISPYLLILGLIVLGFWQVMSGLFGALVLRERNHIHYLFGAFSYLGFLYWFESVDFELPFLPFVLYLAIPIRMAFWKLKLTKETLDKYQLKELVLS